jgi:hypothetical protein
MEETIGFIACVIVVFIAVLIGMRHAKKDEPQP